MMTSDTDDGPNGPIVSVASKLNSETVTQSHCRGPPRSLENLKSESSLHYEVQSIDPIEDKEPKVEEHVTKPTSTPFAQCPHSQGPGTADDLEPGIRYGQGMDADLGPEFAATDPRWGRVPSAGNAQG